MLHKLIVTFAFLISIIWGGIVHGASTGGADFPVGAPDGRGYSNGENAGPNDGWGFSEWNGAVWHPGEDWNRGAGEADFGDPVYSIEGGKIIVAKNYGLSWGRVILIEHKFGSQRIYSQYAHLSKIDKVAGDTVKRGEKIGNIGNANGIWASHLHFEIRQLYLAADFWPSGMSKAQLFQKYLNPTNFINTHRPVKGSDLTLANPTGKNIQATWTRSDSAQFDKYELYRSDIAGGTSESSKRTLLYSTSNADDLSYLDTNASIGTHYYLLTTYFKNGLTAESAEKSITTAYSVELIDDKYGMQLRPQIWGGKILWDDNTEPDVGKPHYLTYYDISTKTKSTINVVGTGSHSISSLSVSGGNAVFSSSGFLVDSGQSHNIYGTNLESGNSYVVSGVRNDEQNPSISEAGIVVWADPRSGGYDIYMLDLTKSEGPKPLITMSGNDQRPIISGRNVIWSRAGKSGIYHNLYMRSLDGGGETFIVEDFDQYYADISGNDVVYVKNGNLWHYSITSGTATQLSTGGKARDPRIKDGKIAYSENGKIHIYDLIAKTNSTIETGNLTVFYPFVSGNYLVFNGIKPGTTADYDVYLIEM